MKAARDTVFVVHTAATGEARGTLVSLGVLNGAAARRQEVGPHAQVTCVCVFFFHFCSVTVVLSCVLVCVCVCVCASPHPAHPPRWSSLAGSSDRH